MPKRIALALFDITSLLASACLVVLVATPQAHAYVDPSVMTYTIQAVAGVAVALSAVLGVALRRTRKALFRVFKIDENANKIVDPVVHAVNRYSPEAESELEKADLAAIADKSRLMHGPEPRKLKWSQRLLRAFIGCSFLVLTVFIASPLEIISSGTSSLDFGYFDALPIVVCGGLIAIAVLSVLLSCLPGRLFDIALTIIVAIGLACYVQTLFLNGPLPAADGTTLNLMKYKSITVISTAAWIFIIGGLLVLNAKKKPLGRTLILTLSVGLIVVQSVSLISISVDNAKDEGDANPSNVLVTTKGEFEVSAENNVIVFVLDFFDTRLMNEVLAEYPDTLNEFTGFTYYENSVGSMIPTRYGLPALLSGEVPREGDTYYEYLSARYERGTFIEDISAQGYDIGLYTTSNYLIPSESKFPAYVDNIVEAGHLELNAPALLSILAKVSLYRESPWILKPLFWFNTDDINNNAISSDMSPYTFDDAKFAETLRSEGLSTSGSEKSFQFIHLNGAHSPYTLDAEGNEANDETDKITQARGSLAMVSDYFKQLKEMGLYDDAFIIVTSDHGDFHLVNGPLPEPVSPIFLVKPRETAEEAAQPFKTSQVPTGHIDFNSTVIDAVGGDTSKYGPTVFEIDEGERPRYYWTTDSDGKNDVLLRQYVISGHVLDIDNWELTGDDIEVPPPSN